MERLKSLKNKRVAQIKFSTKSSKCQLIFIEHEKNRSFQKDDIKKFEKL